MTIFLDMLDAAVALLKQAPALSPNIFESNNRPIAEEFTTSINVQLASADPENMIIAGHPIDWGTQLTIELYARSSVMSGFRAVDPLLGAVFSRMASDPTLGGTVAETRLMGFKAETDAAGQKTGWVGMSYLVIHRTSNDSIAVQN